MDAVTMTGLAKAISDELKPMVEAEVARAMGDFIHRQKEEFRYACDGAAYAAIRDKVDRVLNIQGTVKGEPDNG